MPSPPETIYFSDYFVFVSDSSDDPLVIPLDINWERRPDGRIFTELKVWRGTRGPWPIIYEVETRPLGERPFPESWHDVPPSEGFRFEEGSLRAKSPSLGDLEIRVPPAKEGAAHVADVPWGSRAHTAFRTTARDGERTVPGWLVHERIRMNRRQKGVDGGPRFEEYHWVPFVTPDGLVLVENERGDRPSALRWRPGEKGLVVDGPIEPVLEVTRRAAEAKSRREAVPEGWRIACEPWGTTVSLATTSHHTGYGKEREGRLALFRQALAEGKDGRGRAVHGMMELILTGRDRPDD